MAQELQVMQPILDVNELEAADRFAQVFAKSGVFKDIKQVAQATVKILFGKEVGITAGAAMMGIHLIEGKGPELSPALQAGCVRRSGLGKIDVVESTDEKCILQAYRLEDGQWVAKEPVEFNKQDAIKAELWGRSTWKKYPSDMLYARALSRVNRRYFQDVFIGLGGAVYSPGELSGEVDVTPKATTAPIQAKVTERKPTAQATKKTTKAPEDDYRQAPDLPPMDAEYSVIEEPEQPRSEFWYDIEEIPEEKLPAALSLLAQAGASHIGGDASCVYCSPVEITKLRNREIKK